MVNENIVIAIIVNKANGSTLGRKIRNKDFTSKKCLDF